MKNYTKVTNMETPMMKRELWQELGDRQAETVSGGTGVFLLILSAQSQSVVKTGSLTAPGGTITIGERSV
jgi:hypothetical protein